MSPKFSGSDALLAIRFYARSICSESIASRLDIRFGLAAILLLGTFATPCEAQSNWRRSGGSHSWNSNGNWTGTSQYPNSLTAIANINNNITSNQVIVVNTSVSTGTILLGDSTAASGVFQGFRIQSANGSQALTLGSGGITSSNSNNTIQIRTILGASTFIQHTTASASLLMNGDVNLASFFLTVNGSGQTTIAGSISGTGSLIKLGGGALTLAGTNSYSGGTTISAGTLIGTTTSLQGPITNNSITVFDQATTGSYSGSMSGTGSLVKQGGGTVTLVGNNTFTGGTTVAAGTLKGSTSSLQGTIINNASLVMDQTSNGTYSGSMSGTGSLVKQGNGDLTLAGNNSYSGGTTVDSGKLIGNTSSIQGSVTNNSTVEFRQTSNGIYSGNISGAGTVIKSGSGTVGFAGAQSFTGDTLITAGVFRLNSGASLASTKIRIDSGATLDVSQLTAFVLTAGQTVCGTGQIVGGLTQSAGSTISPGASPGTLNVNGNLTLEGAAHYLWEINDATGAAGNSTGWDVLRTTGALIVNATSVNPYIIQVSSLLPSNSPGNVINFDPGIDYDWEIIGAAGGITGFSASAFTVNSTGFTNNLSAFPNHSFQVRQSGNSLFLHFASVPEPSTLSVALLIGLGLASARRSRNG